MTICNGNDDNYIITYYLLLKKNKKIKIKQYIQLVYSQHMIPPHHYFLSSQVEFPLILSLLSLKLQEKFV